MMAETNTLILVFFVLCGFGVMLAPMVSDSKNPKLLAWVAFPAALALLWAGGQVLISGQPWQTELWKLPFWGTLRLRMDFLSALFISLTASLFLPVSLFSAGYLSRYRRHYSLQTFSLFYHLLFASIALVLLSGDILSFLLTWEAMSILSYLLVNYEHEREETVRSGFLMLAMGEAGTLAAALGLLLLARPAEGFDFPSLKSAAAGFQESARWAVFLFSFLGFGVKAGLVPTSTWLPRAHPVAPANVSALLSGIILNLGIYGIVRVNADLLPVRDLGPGLIALLVGSLSALIGILYATTENDLKRMLAHSSIENMGIVTAGLGAGFVFMASNLPVLAGIAFIAALYHMTNHSFYKCLLFLGSGAVDIGVGERNMDRLGGLIRRMPWTALFFLAATLSIAALPPFNGFVSEWLTLQTLLQSAHLPSAGVKIIFALCGGGLALTAALAVTCFAKSFAMIFLGSARSEGVQKAVEVRRSMRVPMGLLAVSCFLLGILPTYFMPVLDRVTAPLVGQSVIDELVPPFFTVSPGDPRFSESFVAEFHDLGAQVGRGLLPGRGWVVLHRGSERNPVVFAMSSSYTFFMLVLLLGGAFLVIQALTRNRKVERKEAWAGGIRRLLPEMTYTATGFSNPVRVVFQAIFRPSLVADKKETVEEHFRTAIRNGRQEVHIVDRSVFRPMVRTLETLAARLGKMHAGSVNLYAAYVLISLVAVLIIQLFL
jgi:hydrogenase-4 component B